MLVRVSGLPPSLMAAFSTRLPELRRELDESEADLAHRRGQLVDALYALIGDADPEVRHALLRVKRDAYNARPLERHRESPDWPLLEEVAGDLLTPVLDLERRRDERRKRADEAYATALDEEQRTLQRTVEDEAFARGLAAASQVVSQAAERWRRRPVERFRSRDLRLSMTLLRYVSRAAVKLSPFSTFTAVGLGRVRPSPEPGPARFTNGPWRARSLVRVRRFVLDQVGGLLRLNPHVRERLPVALNDSLGRLTDGRCNWLRPNRWVYDESQAKLVFQAESLVRAPVPETWLQTVKESLAPGGVTWRSLERSLRRRGEASEDLDRWLDAGLLVQPLPWPEEAGHLERHIADGLAEILERAGQDGLGEDDLSPLEAVLLRLRELLELETGLADARRPDQVHRRLATLLQEIEDSAVRAAGLDGDTEIPKPSPHDVYEDVFLEPAAPEHRHSGVIAEVPSTSVHQALDDVEPLLRLSRLFNHRHEILLSLSAFCRRSWPDRQRVGLLECFAAFQPHFQDFVRWSLASRDGEGWSATWNPLELPAVDDLAEHRSAARRGLEGCLEVVDGETRVRRSALARLLAPVPRSFTGGPGGASLFLQQADPGGELWMVNRVKEGTGRYASRYTPAMSPPLRRAYTSLLAEDGDRGPAGGEFLDLYCPQGDTLNIHTPQTPKVLLFPEAGSRLPAGRRVSLGDLHVHWDDRPAPAVLGDAGDGRYTTVHLGLAHVDYMPTLFKFLCTFGPSELSAVFVPPTWIGSHGVRRRLRTRMGSVILHRRAWSVPAAELRRHLEADATEEERFRSLDRWREEHSIPPRVYLVERVPHPDGQGETTQPQYLDLTSPLFTRIFCEICGDEPGDLLLVEPLPPPDAFPETPAGDTSSLELLIDTRLLGHHPRPPVGAEPAEAGAGADAM